MRKQFTCANGHEWKATAGNGLAVETIACPECGSTAETAVGGAVGDVAFPASVSTMSTRSRPVASAPSPSSSAPAGSLSGSFGRYEIQQELGKGGMGRVYMAFDRELRRVIALKIPHCQPHDPASLQRFKLEAQAAATFNHPNLCPVFDVGEYDGTYYLMMPFIAGHSLAAMIDSTRQSKKQFPERQVALVVRKLALALDHAHRKGVLNRD